MNEAIGPSTWSRKGPTWEPSSTSWVVSVAATIWPVSASRPMCNFRQDRRALVPCFSTSHSPGPQSLRPVLSTKRCTGSALRPDCGCGTSRVAARRLRVVWSGTERSRPSRPMMEPIRPSVWRRAKRNTALRVRAVVIARSESCGWPPGVVRGSACQATIASSENQTVRLPRWRKAASYSAQFVTRRRCFGIRWRRAALALNGIGGSRVIGGVVLLRQPPLHANRPIRATNSRTALEAVARLLPTGIRPVLIGDRFYGSPDLIGWCCEQGGDGRLPLKQNRLGFEEGGETTLAACFDRGEHQLRGIELTETRVRTHVAMVHEAGHPEPWIIALSQTPSVHTAFDDGLRWGIEAMFSDFKTRGFGLEDSQIRLAGRLDRLILIMALALFWAVSTGMWDAVHRTTRAEKNPAMADPGAMPDPSPPCSSGACGAFTPAFTA